MLNKIKALTLVASVMTGLFAFAPANADPSCAMIDGSAGNIHIEDAGGDFNGVLSGNGQALFPFGDVAGESGDIREVWFSKTEGTTPNKDKYFANVRLGNLDPTAQNVNVYASWWTTGDTAQRNYVSVAFNGPRPASFSYGHYETTAAGTSLASSDGNTTGTVTTGPDGLVTIAIPFNRAELGSLSRGAVIDTLAAESYFLVGHSSVGGSLQPLDDTDDADIYCDEVTL